MDIDHVGDVGEAAVPERVLRRDKRVLRCGQVRKAERLGRLRVGDELRHRPDLQQVQLVRLVDRLSQVDRELNLHWACERGRTELQEEGEGWRERERVAAHNLLHRQLGQLGGRRVRRGLVRLRAVGEHHFLPVRVERLQLDDWRVLLARHRLHQAELRDLRDVELVERRVAHQHARLAHARLVGELEGQEVLRLADRVRRVTERPVHRRVPVDDRRAEAVRHGCAAVVRRGVQPRVEVDRVRDASERGREHAGRVLLARDRLNDDRHLLVGDRQPRRLRVPPRLDREDGRVHLLDGRRERAHALWDVAPRVAQHVRLVHAGEGLLERILEERGGAHCDRRAHALRVLLESVHRIRREGGRVEERLDIFVGLRHHHRRDELVRIHEAVEHVGGEDEALWHLELDLRHQSSLNVEGVHQVVHQPEPAPLAAERALADAHDRRHRVGLRRVGHGAGQPVAQREHRGDHPVAQHLFLRLEAGRGIVRQEVIRVVRRREVRGEHGLGTRAEPLRERVGARGAVDDVLRQVGVHLHQLRDVVRLRHHLPRLGGELERAEEKRLPEEVAQLEVQRGRVLVQEGHIQLGRLIAHQLLRRLHEHLDVRPLLLDVLDEVQPGVGVPLAVAKEGDVRDDRHRLVLVPAEDVGRLLVVGAQQHLRPRLHAVEPLRLRHALVLQRGRLLDQLGVHHRHVHRVELDVVLDEQDDLRAVLHVVDRVEPVLHRLEHGGEEREVALPQEGPQPRLRERRRRARRHRHVVDLGRRA
mmetsp:Transcript_977/g.2631  ORF Transcript_977/g.2631 Transcript_977/m.2631 type:complete len:759 (+) Transcript_977:741-3017(+)